MVILGVDPGFSFTGFAVLQQQKLAQKTRILECHYLKLPQQKHLSYRIGLFYNFFEQKIQHWQVTHLALETPFLGKNAQNFLKLGYLRGVLYLLANQHEISLFEFSPREVKQAVTGFGGAQKDQVARIVLQLFPGLDAPEKKDVTDALAVSLCALWRSPQKMT